MSKFKPKVIVMTSDRYLWANLPFAYLFNTYWSSLQQVELFGFSRPQYTLPKNFKFHSLDTMNYPAERWTNALQKALTILSDEIVVIMLEDYWLCRTVDWNGVQMCVEYMLAHPNVLRFDLTDDRQYAGGSEIIDSYGHYDIVETKSGTPYQVSLQAALWNTKLLSKILLPNKSAWEFEIHTSPPTEMRVLGTRQCPVRYANAIHKGELDLKHIRRIPSEHLNFIRPMIPGADK